MEGIPVLRERGNPSLLKRLWVARWLYLIMLPGLLYYLIYKFIPMGGVIIVFKDYQPFLGILGSDWVGLEHFKRFFSEPEFMTLLKNTFILGFYGIIFYFPVPIILALMLNEVRHESYKRIVQTAVYLPHFLSWVVVVGIFFLLLSVDKGSVNNLIAALGMDKISFMTSENWLRPLYVLQNIWKDAGWGTIIFLAALSGVDIQMYEAARIDGASRLRQLWHITIPAIRSTIVILLILRLGNFMDIGFEHIFLLLNPINREMGEVFDTNVYQVGITQGQFSYSATVGLFKSVVGLVLVVGANYLAKKYGEEGIF
jgi:putative aldouronate transport system permease protein